MGTEGIREVQEVHWHKKWIRLVLDRLAAFVPGIEDRSVHIHENAVLAWLRSVASGLVDVSS